MRKIILPLFILGLVALGGLWKFRVLEPIIWRLFSGSKTAQTLSEPFISFRPKNLPENLLNENERIAGLIEEPFEKDKVKIHISKSKYELTFIYENKEIKDYAIVLGGDPVNDKLREGDKRTPEGKFKIKDLYPHQAWSKFIWIDYPTADSWKKHNRAQAKGEIGAGDGIGGEIGIHGVPGENDKLIDDGVNWTVGCISLKTKDINELFSVVQAGTTVEISH